MTDDEFKLVIDDARHRQTALLNLIVFTDQQALGLLRLYVTIGVAAATGAAVGFVGNDAIPFVVAGGLAGVVIALFVGIIYCYRAMQTAEIGLPGRGADFWKAAIGQPDITYADAVSQYLSELENQQARDRHTNGITAGALKRAKWAGAAALAVALAAGLIGLLVRFLPF